MGMGFGANYADVISADTVARLCPGEYTALQVKLETVELDWENFGRACQFEGQELDSLFSDLDGYDDRETIADGILESYHALQKAFEAATETNGSHLRLFASHHDHDDGDRYDDVQGFFWCVSGNYQLSPAGERFKEEIERQFFVSFG